MGKIALNLHFHPIRPRDSEQPLHSIDYFNILI